MHTQGPWIYDETWALIKGPKDEEVCAVHSGANGQQRQHRNIAQSNARLIAAAPDLLAALQMLTQAVYTEYPEGAPFKFRRLLIEADEAIAKATA